MAAQAIGEPLPPAARSLMAKIETQVDQADEGNDALVEGEQKVTDALGPQRRRHPRPAASGCC